MIVVEHLRFGFCRRVYWEALYTETEAECIIGKYTSTNSDEWAEKSDLHRHNGV